MDERWLCPSESHPEAGYTLSAALLEIVIGVEALSSAGRP
jgi:hypothetical protein